MPLTVRDHIILDNINTWPVAIRRLLTTEEGGIRSFLREERRFDRLAESDVMIRNSRPTNPHQDSWDRTVEAVRELVRAQPIIGFHCARLARGEIDDVRANGLRPLSPCLTSQRIEKLAYQGLISPAAARALMERNVASATNREGMIWFFHALSTLRDESGLYRLFRYWGGEAVYSYHEKDPGVCNELRRIGTPCIVVAALDPSEVGIIGRLEERMVRVWMDRRKAGVHSRDCDTYVKRRVRVIDVIIRADTLFEELTVCSNWHHSIDAVDEKPVVG